MAALLSKLMALMAWNGKADILAKKLTAVLDNEAKISRFTIRAKLKISGLDDSATVTEIEHIISDFGNCPMSDVRSSEIRWMRNGLSTV